VLCSQNQLTKMLDGNSTPCIFYMYVKNNCIFLALFRGGADWTSG